MKSPAKLLLEDYNLLKNEDMNTIDFDNLQITYRITFEVVTPSSAEQGDAEDRGFILTGGKFYSMTPGHIPNEATYITDYDDFKQNCRYQDIGFYNTAEKTFSSHELDGDEMYAFGSKVSYTVHILKVEMNQKDIPVNEFVSAAGVDMRLIEE